MNILYYFSTLHTRKLILWCYLIWYLVTVYFHFDATPRIWLSSLGISLVIGIALQLSIGDSFDWNNNKWQTVRLFLMPFCVSSFSTLIKGCDFVLIFSPNLTELIFASLSCILFIMIVFALKKCCHLPKHL